MDAVRGGVAERRGDFSSLRAATVRRALSPAASSSNSRKSCCCSRRSSSSIEELDAAARTREIGRMLSGQTLTPEALKHAEQLIRMSVA